MARRFAAAGWASLWARARCTCGDGCPSQRRVQPCRLQRRAMAHCSPGVHCRLIGLRKPLTACPLAAARSSRLAVVVPSLLVTFSGRRVTQRRGSLRFDFPGETPPLYGAMLGTFRESGACTRRAPRLPAAVVACWRKFNTGSRDSYVPSRVTTDVYPWTHNAWRSRRYTDTLHVCRRSRYAARPLTACNSECHRRRRRSVALSGDDGTRCNDSWLPPPPVFANDTVTRCRCRHNPPGRPMSPPLRGELGGCHAA